MKEKYPELFCKICCCVSRVSQAHLSLTVRLHQFNERRLPLDLELYDRSILTRNLQVYVLVAFCLDGFLSGKIRGGKWLTRNQRPMF